MLPQVGLWQYVGFPQVRLNLSYDHSNLQYTWSFSQESGLRVQPSVKLAPPWVCTGPLGLLMRQLSHRSHLLIACAHGQWLPISTKMASHSRHCRPGRRIFLIQEARPTAPCRSSTCTSELGAASALHPPPVPWRLADPPNEHVLLRCHRPLQPHPWHSNRLDVSCQIIQIRMMCPSSQEIRRQHRSFVHEHTCFVPTHTVHPLDHSLNQPPPHHTRVNGPPTTCRPGASTNPERTRVPTQVDTWVRESTEDPGRVDTWVQRSPPRGNGWERRGRQGEPYPIGYGTRNVDRTRHLCAHGWNRMDDET